MPDVTPPGGGGGAASAGAGTLSAYVKRFGVVYPHRVPTYQAATTGPSSGATGTNDTPFPEPLWLLNPLLAAKVGGFVPPTLVFQPGTPPAPPTPPGSRRGPGSPLVPRDATADQRLRRHTEAVQVMLNSLIRKGQLVFLGGNEWEIRLTKFVEGRAPTATDDETVGATVGDLWADTAGNIAWMCFRTDPGVAVWVALN